MKYDKGPWKGLPPAVIGRREMTGRWIVDAKGKRIANVTGSPEISDKQLLRDTVRGRPLKIKATRDGNVSLIAAAPELYRAAKNIEQHGPSFNRLSALKAAILKAEGRE